VTGRNLIAVRSGSRSLHRVDGVPTGAIHAAIPLGTAEAGNDCDAGKECESGPWGMTVLPQRRLRYILATHDDAMPLGKSSPPKLARVTAMIRVAMRPQTSGPSRPCATHPTHGRGIAPCCTA